MPTHRRALWPTRQIDLTRRVREKGLAQRSTGYLGAVWNWDCLLGKGKGLKSVDSVAHNLGAVPMVRTVNRK